MKSNSSNTKIEVLELDVLTRKLKNPILFSIVGVFIVLTILDIITSYFILPGEGNPIYLLTKSIIFLFIFKVGLIVLACSIYKYNTYPSNFQYYLFLIMLVLGNVLITLALISNVIGILNPVYVEQASTLSTTEKTQGYVSFVGLIYLLPLLFSIFTFKLYEWSVGTIKYEKKKFKDSHWWKFER